MVTLTTLIALAAIVGLIAAARGRGRRTETEAGEGSVRRTRGTNAVQRRIGAALGVLALAIFIFGIVVTESAREVEPTGSKGLTTAQKDLDLPSGDSAPLEITVSGQQWLWRYEYPDGTFSYYDLVVPVDTAVVLDVESTDVLHRWWIPALGGMFDAVPGQSNRAWFKADETGVYDGQSTAYSGPAYAQMRARVTVVEPAEYEAWLAEQAADIKEAQEMINDRVEAGDTLGVELEAEAAAADPAAAGEPAE
jgi:cytochrome c oxidase subunit 2